MRLAQAGNAGAEAELRCAVDLAPNDPGYLMDIGTDAKEAGGIDKVLRESCEARPQRSDRSPVLAG